MRKSNIFLCVTLSLSIFVAPLKVRAQSDLEQPQIIIEQGAEDVSSDIINELIQENPDAGVIHLMDYDYITKPSNENNFEFNNDYNFNQTNDSNYDSNTIAGPISFYTKVGNVSTQKYVTTYNQVAKDEFKFSVARGEEVTLSEKYSGSLKGSFSGEVFDSGKIGADITITGEYAKGTRYYGPDNSSAYNTREFRMKFYQNVGTYKQTATIYYYYLSTIYDKKQVTKEGTYKQPTKYLSYSVDKKLK